MSSVYSFTEASNIHTHTTRGCKIDAEKKKQTLPAALPAYHERGCFSLARVGRFPDPSHFLPNHLSTASKTISRTRSGCGDGKSSFRSSPLNSYIGAGRPFFQRYTSHHLPFFSFSSLILPFSVCHRPRRQSRWRVPSSQGPAHSHRHAFARR